MFIRYYRTILYGKYTINRISAEFINRAFSHSISFSNLIFYIYRKTFP